MDAILFGVKISVIAFVIVFVALILVYYVITSFKYLDRWLARTAKPEHPVTVKTEDGIITPEMIAAISAAIAVTISKKFIIKKVRYRSGRQDTIWTVGGRATMMSTRTAAERRS